MCSNRRFYQLTHLLNIHLCVVQYSSLCSLSWRCNVMDMTNINVPSCIKTGSISLIVIDVRNRINLEMCICLDVVLILFDDKYQQARANAWEWVLLQCISATQMLLIVYTVNYVELGCWPYCQLLYLFCCICHPYFKF